MSEYPYRPLVAWMVENNVPDDWADDALVIVDEATREIQVEMFMRHPDGGTMLHGSHVMTEMRTFPMLTPPPPGLLDAYERLRTSLREERSAVAALKRQALDDIIRELQDMGYADAAQWLASRRLANPAPARKLAKFNVEVARFGPRTYGSGITLQPGCTITVRDGARLYAPGGAIVGFLEWCGVEGGTVLGLAGMALPRVVDQFYDFSHYPSLDIWVREWADEPTCQVATSAEIIGAMVAEIATYPWPVKGDSDVRS